MGSRGSAWAVSTSVRHSPQLRACGWLLHSLDSWRWNRWERLSGSLMLRRGFVLDRLQVDSVHRGGRFFNTRLRLLEAFHFLPLLRACNKTSTPAALGPLIVVSHTPPWLASRWGCRGRRPSTD